MNQKSTFLAFVVRSHPFMGRRFAEFDAAKAFALSLGLNAVYEQHTDGIFEILL